MSTPVQLESGFADGTYASFISGPWHAGLVEDAGLSQDSTASRRSRRGRLPAPPSWAVATSRCSATPTTRSTRGSTSSGWATPGTQQGFYEAVGDLPAVKSAWDRELADDPQLKIFGEQPTARPRRPSPPGTSSPARSTARRRRRPSGGPSADEAVRPCRSRPSRSAPVSDLPVRRVRRPRSLPDRDACRRPGGRSPAQSRVDPTRRQQAVRRVGAGPAVRAPLPRLHARAGARRPRHDVHRPRRVDIRTPFDVSSSGSTTS